MLPNTLERMTTEQLSLKIKDKLLRPTTITSRKFCMEDITHNPIVLEEFLGIVLILRQLVGRTVKSVELNDTPTRDENPRGDIGQFIIHLEP